MDDRRFDALTRTIASAAWTRRRALHGLAGGALAGLLANLGLEEASAACVKPGKRGCRGSNPKPCCAGAACKGGNKTRPGRCVCKPGLATCGPACVNTKANTQHCDGCYKPCAAGQSCQGGSCVGGTSSGCQAGTTLCGTDCVDTATDNQHCGGCNTFCGTTCAQGTCPNPPPPGPITCQSGYNFCNASSAHDLNAIKCSETANCYCITDVDGVAYCSDRTVHCTHCATNADCQNGWVCIPATGPNCLCAPPLAGTNRTGNGCAPPSCFNPW